MPQLNRDLLREVFYELVKEDGCNKTIVKFMMAGKEPFQVVLDHCKKADSAFLFSDKVVAKLPNIQQKTCYEYNDLDSDDADYGQPVAGTTISTDMVLFKPISIALATSLTNLHLYSFSPKLIPMLKSIDHVMKKICIKELFEELKDILEPFINIPFVEDGVIIQRTGVTLETSDDELEEWDFGYGMKSFAIPCHKLTIKDAYFNTLLHGIQDMNLKNSYLHEIRDLTIRGGFTKTSIKEIKDFVTFLSLNFPNLETLNVYFELRNHKREFFWNWNDTEMANCLKALPPGIKGSLCFEIFEQYVTIDHAKYPDVEESGSGEYYKIYPVSDTLSFKIALCEDYDNNDADDYYHYYDSYPGYY